jgi:hypothetical protein
MYPSSPTRRSRAGLWDCSVPFDKLRAGSAGLILHPLGLSKLAN